MAESTFPSYDIVGGRGTPLVTYVALSEDRFVRVFRDEQGPWPFVIDAEGFNFAPISLGVDAGNKLGEELARRADALDEDRKFSETEPEPFFWEPRLTLLNMLNTVGRDGITSVPTIWLTATPELDTPHWHQHTAILDSETARALGQCLTQD